MLRIFEERAETREQASPLDHELCVGCLGGGVAGDGDDAEVWQEGIGEGVDDLSESTTDEVSVVGSSDLSGSDESGGGKGGGFVLRIEGLNVDDQPFAGCGTAFGTGLAEEA